MPESVSCESYYKRLEALPEPRTVCETLAVQLARDLLMELYNEAPSYQWMPSDIAEIPDINRKHLDLPLVAHVTSEYRSASGAYSPHHKEVVIRCGIENNKGTNGEYQFGYYTDAAASKAAFAEALANLHKNLIDHLIRDFYNA